MADGAGIAQKTRDTSSNAGTFGDCQRCDKQGLPILPLRFAYAYWQGRTETSVKANLSETDFKQMSGELLMRPLSQGYLHVLDERNGGTWRVFFVGSDGALWEFPAKTTPNASDYQCGRTDHGVRSSMFMVTQPQDAKRIWLSYASTLYTPAQLDIFKTAILQDKVPADADEQMAQYLRTRFHDFDVPSLMAMAKGATGTNKALGIAKDGGNLQALVREYCGVLAPFQASITPARDLSGIAAAIGERVHGVCSRGMGGVALYLDDPMGVAQEIRHHEKVTRLQIEAIDAKYSRQLRAKGLIDQLEKAWGQGANPGEKKEKSAEWVSDYRDKLNAASISQFESAYKREKGTLDGALSLLGDDAKRYMESFNFERAARCDFDAEDVRSTTDMVCQLGTVLCGLELSASGRALAQQLLDKPIEENLWYRAMLAGQKPLLKFLKEDQGSDVLGSFKTAYGVVDEWINAYQKMAATLHLSAGATLSAASGAAAQLGQADPLFRATLPLAEAVQQLTLSLQGLLTRAQNAAFKQVRIFALVGALWHRAVAIPFYEEKTLAALVRENNEAAWGAPIESRNQQFIDPEGRRVAKVKLGDYASELGEAGLKKIPLLRIRFGDPPDVSMMSAEGARDASRQQRRQEARAERRAEGRRMRNGPGPQKTALAVAMEQGLKKLAEDLEVLRQAEARNARVSAAAARNQARVGLPSATPQAAVVPAALATLQRSPSRNWLSDAVKLAKNGGVNGAFSAWIGALQVTSLAASYKELQEKPDEKTWAKVIGSTLGVVGAFAEVIAAGYLLTGASADKALILRLTPARIAGVGGVIGGVSGVVGGVLTFIDGYERFQSADNDSGAALMLGGVFMTAGGAAAAAGGMASVVSGGLVLGLGPVAWGVLALGLAILGIAAIFVGDAWKDNGLQAWLRSCCFGIKPSYNDGRQEQLAFEKLFEIPMELCMQWRKGIFGHGTIIVEIDVPDIAAGEGVLSYTLTFTMTDGSRHMVAEHRRLVDPRGTGISDPIGLSSGVMGRVQGLSPPTTGGVLGATDKGGVRWIMGYYGDALAMVAVHLRYMPEGVSQPNLVIPAPDGLSRSITMADAI
ncbi:toxin VasX [Stenotrophomonas sp. Iso1]|uniref:toxin VasX n=1 Tax=Stenotrophomonas sp. Iso1 TaxID=2977283 RepID=UPI0022B77C08|nr:toxin VasX [Stenotrophomonas sp. Iso1]